LIKRHEPAKGGSLAMTCQTAYHQLDSDATQMCPPLKNSNRNKVSANEIIFPPRLISFSLVLIFVPYEAALKIT